jgi:hypothetical protein
LFNDLHNILLKYVGIDTVIEQVVRKLGDLEKVFLCGDYASGKAMGPIEFIFVGDDIDEQYLSVLLKKAEKLINRTIKYSLKNRKEFLTGATYFNDNRVLLLWTRDRDKINKKGRTIPGI